MIIASIISFCRWIAGVMWRRGVETASIVDDSHLPLRLPTLATNREEPYTSSNIYTISSPDDDEYYSFGDLFDEIIISE